jgi:hypothetical protein
MEAGRANNQECFGALSRLVEVGADAGLQYSTSGALCKHP